MADVPALIHEQILTRLANAGAIHGEHTVTYSKNIDINYEVDRKTFSLVQAAGVREVTSQSGQTGVPLAGGIAKSTP